MKKSGVRWILSVALLLGLVSIGLGRSLVEKIAKDVLKQTPKGRKILKDFERYKNLAHIFKKYHDSKALDDQDLLMILREAGIAGEGAGHTSKGNKPPPKPFPVSTYGGQYRWPMDAGIVSSEYGPRWGKTHQGVDIAADSGVPIHAIAPGEVVYAGDQIIGYGNVAILRHDQKTSTTYAHNKSLKVKTGDKVRAGQVVALLGSSGHSTGPHLHFEFRVANRPVNPREKLPKSRF